MGGGYLGADARFALGDYGVGEGYDIDAFGEESLGHSRCKARVLLGGGGGCERRSSRLLTQERVHAFCKQA